MNGQKITKLLFLRKNLSNVYQSIYISYGCMDGCPHFFSLSAAVQIKILILRKLFEVLNNLGLDPFQTPSAIFGPPGGHFGVCRLS